LRVNSNPVFSWKLGILNPKLFIFRTNYITIPKIIFQKSQNGKFKGNKKWFENFVEKIDGNFEKKNVLKILL